MIVGFIGNLLAYIMPAKYAEWAARGVLLALAALALWWAYSWAYDNGRDDERARWEAAAAKLVAADAKADAAGTVTAAETKGRVDATNEQAKADADRSVDPLNAIAERLRAEGDRGRN